jgi:hypothetical protein
MDKQTAAASAESTAALWDTKKAEQLAASSAEMTAAWLEPKTVAMRDIW